MAPVWNILRNSITSFIVLWVCADCEQCTSTHPAHTRDEETSLLQLHLQTSIRSVPSKASGPWHEWEEEKEARRAAQIKWAEKKASMRKEWAAKAVAYKAEKKAEFEEAAKAAYRAADVKNGQIEDHFGDQADDEATDQAKASNQAVAKKTHEVGDQASDKTVGQSANKIAEQTLTEDDSANPFQKVGYELAVDCPEFADQAACDEAIWLAGLLRKLTQDKSEDVISEADRLLSLESWFQNPAGPSGFFNFLDTDHNGGLDAKELTEYGGAGLLRIIDGDLDGYASRHECQTFLRGCAVLFHVLPTHGSNLSKMPAPMMLKLADTVTIESTVGVAQSVNPFTEVASSLQNECPPPADAVTCYEASALALLLVNLTKSTPPEQVVAQASSILSLWYWFQNPQGPAGFFNAIDNKHRGSITASELIAIPGNNADVSQVVRFLDANNDGKASRAEVHTYLRACAILIHKLPMLDLASATTPLDYMFTLADSVVKQTLSGSSPLAWSVSVSCSTMMILCILYGHCWPSSKKKKEEVEESEDEEQTPSQSGDNSWKQHLVAEPSLQKGLPDPLAEDTDMPPPRSACKANCPEGDCSCHTESAFEELAPSKADASPKVAS